jgi:hypothetical protein
MRDLIETRDGASYMAQKISGVWLRYDLPGDHPLIGCSAPDLEFEDGTRLGTFLHDGKAVLLDLVGREELKELGDLWAGRLKYVSCQAKDGLGLSALLIRPDGFVVWAAEGEPDEDEARSIAERWLGTASYTKDLPGEKADRITP